MTIFVRSRLVRTALGVTALLIVAGTLAAELLGYDALTSSAPVVAGVLAWAAVK